jgi:hypothetical protein
VVRVARPEKRSFRVLVNAPSAPSQSAKVRLS